jgi:hypothetical protein
MLAGKHLFNCMFFEKTHLLLSSFIFKFQKMAEVTCRMQASSAQCDDGVQACLDLLAMMEIPITKSRLVLHARFSLVYLLVINHSLLIAIIHVVSLQTKLRLPNNRVLLIFKDLNHNLGVVMVLGRKGGCLRAACLDHQQQLEAHSQVVSVRRSFSSGKLVATAGMLAGDPTGAHREEVV